MWRCHNSVLKMLNHIGNFMMSHNSCQWRICNPMKLLTAGKPIVLLILNQPIKELAKELIKLHWSTAVLRIAVDGGLIHLRENDQKYVPDIICGDFDSLTVDVRDLYAKMGAQVIHTPDQDETDFTKALKICIKTLQTKNLKADAILAIGNSGGRLDHILGNLNTLYRISNLSSIPVYLVGNNTLTWLLEAGKHKVVVEEEVMDGHIGLVPLGEPCLNATTTGLKWNLFHSKMEFGGLISICNRFDGSDCVTVETEQRLIWTMEMNRSIVKSDSNTDNDT